MIEDGALTPADVQVILDSKAEALASEGVLEYLPASDNAYQLGGFGRLKSWLERARVGFSEEARALNLKAPRGILLVGVQGCGKSLAAKSTAGAWRLPLLKLDAGRLYDKYVGETEKNLRRALEIAESMAPVVLWIDELEKSLSSGGERRRRREQARARHVPHLAPGEEAGGVRRRDRERRVRAAARAPPQGPLRRDLLRRPARRRPSGRRSCASTSRTGSRRPSASTSPTSPTRPRAGAARSSSRRSPPRCTARCTRSALSTRRCCSRRSARTVPLSVSRREDVERLRALGRERFVPVR